MGIIITQSPEETKQIAMEIVALLASEKGVRGTSTIIALKGDLGAGKTVFVKGVAEHLGFQGVVTSPTFVIEKIYALPEGAPWRHLIHIDAYRLEGEEELDSIGWSAIATDPNNLICIEWPEQVGFGVPERACWIEIEATSETQRTITLPEVFTLEGR